jgi:hypothetical protein
MDKLLSHRFRERFERAHSQSRPLILDWEMAVEVRTALEEMEKTGPGMPGYTNPNCDCITCVANRIAHSAGAVPE